MAQRFDVADMDHFISPANDPVRDAGKARAIAIDVGRPAGPVKSAEIAILPWRHGNGTGWKN